MDYLELIPTDLENNKEQIRHNRGLTKCWRNDRNQWWATKVEEMEKAAAVGINRHVFKLNKQTSTRNPGVSEIIF